ncbi:MAG: O-antigen ligase family protein [Edaphobacter sp.]|uniref:O-antigen ligase family protein n=1 Tax=Edaphobacter sp. TaxID=1934404 RepID=UPI0023A024B5|nr:O-antigen ligase family protein [Edaphobacter sp.]MDE1175007.1 O-antigen ligase family protein [Edaphobacter sp.]
MSSIACDERCASRAAITISLIPIFDCILNQLNTAFGASLGGMSPLQATRGSLLLVFMGICTWTIVRNPRKLLSAPLPVLAGVALIALAISKEISQTGSISLSGIVPYGQFLYWLLLWMSAVFLCSSKEDALAILKGLAIGSVMTAASVFLGLALGTGNFYSGDAVKASAGWFETAKMITGVLTTGGVILLYLGQQRQGWMYPILACLNFSACILTYARAGTVAMVVALVWLFVWLCLWGHESRRSGIKFVVLCTAIGIVAMAMMSPAQVLSRWNDMEDGGGAGSGRATFWKIAIDDFYQADVLDQVAGRGYASMSTMLFQKYGDDIKHTHNDGLDMLLVGGLTGCFWLFLFVLDLSAKILRRPISSKTTAAAIAILLIYLCHGQLTGQIWGTDAMSYYTLALASLCMIDDLPVLKQATELAHSVDLTNIRHPYPIT